MSSVTLPDDANVIRRIPPPRGLTIVIAEDDDGHAELVRLQLEEAGVTSPILRFVDGQQVLDFFFRRGPGPHRESGRCYVLLLDIRMPKVDGLEVLEQMKADRELRKIPVIMLTTTDDPRAVENCYRMGCSLFIRKPVEAEAFFETLQRLALFLQTVVPPRINGPDLQVPSNP